MLADTYMVLVCVYVCVRVYSPLLPPHISITLHSHSHDCGYRGIFWTASHVSKCGGRRRVEPWLCIPDWWGNKGAWLPFPDYKKERRSVFYFISMPFYPFTLPCEKEKRSSVVWLGQGRRKQHTACEAWHGVVVTNKENTMGWDDVHVSRVFCSCEIVLFDWWGATIVTLWSTKPKRLSRDRRLGATKATSFFCRGQEEYVQPHPFDLFVRYCLLILEQETAVAWLCIRRFVVYLCVQQRGRSNGWCAHECEIIKG